MRPALLVATLLLGANSALAEGDVGLSSVRAQRFVDEVVEKVYLPHANDLFGSSFAVGDFDHDGRDDLATGATGHDGPFTSPQNDTGVVFLRPGTNGGLATAPGHVLGEFSAGSPITPAASDQMGRAVAACDFDGDSFVDLAVGVPFRNDSGVANSGAILVFEGTAQGLRTFAPLYLSQESAHVPSTSVDNDHFGEALACGDFNADGFGDLAVGVPLEDYPSGAARAGAVIILPGSSLGLGQIDGVLLDQTPAGVATDPGMDDHFGAALAVGDFDDDTFADLAIGVPGELSSSGVVHVFFGGAAGLPATEAVSFNESSMGGQSEVGDQFGFELCTGDFDGDGRSDLAIGIPYEDFAPIVDYGQIAVLYGTASSTFDRVQFWEEDTLLSEGASLSSERFGTALAAGDFDGDGRYDLAAGAPGESYAATGALGMVVAWMGSASGLSAGRVRAFRPGDRGIPGSSGAAGSYFGSNLAAGDFDGDGHADLAIGAPPETVDGLAAAGTETILYGSLFADGFETVDSALWSGHVP